MFCCMSDKGRDLGLLMLRVGIGVMFIGHGLPKLMDGPVAWEGIGGAMGNFGVTFAPAFWGFMAALSEGLGGLLLALGLFTRPACALMAFTMVVATSVHLGKGDGFFTGASHAVEACVIFVSMIAIGPGTMTLDALLRGGKKGDPAA